ncbi:MAG TPA: hypothetical protein VNO32_06965 [Candidatus Acidoferrum sp.]|jgi:hypothetical protein|nr:hypothetical protein [Candidatus Acidoferrum sp.]
MTPAEIRKIRKALATKIVYTPALIRRLKKLAGQGRPNTGRIS